MNTSQEKDSIAGATAAMLTKAYLWPDGFWCFRDDYSESMLLTRSDDFYETYAIYDEDLDDWVILD